MIAKDMHTVDTAESLQPDDCRKLLAGVGPMVALAPDLGSCAAPAIDSGIIANEHPGDIRTVHTTEKILVPYHPPECDIPEEVCDVSCIAENFPDRQASEATADT